MSALTKEDRENLELLAKEMSKLTKLIEELIETLDAVSYTHLTLPTKA